MSGVGAAAAGAGGLKPMTATPSGNASGSRSGAGSSTVTSNTVTISVANAFGSVGYSWALISSSAGMARTDVGPGQAYWSKTMSGDVTINETWRCTVTDSIGRTATADVNVQLVSSSGA